MGLGDSLIRVVLTMFLEFGADISGILGSFETASGVPIFQCLATVDSETLRITLPFLQALDGEDINDSIHIGDLSSGRIVTDDSINKSDDFVVWIALVDQVQVSAKGQVGNDIESQQTEGSISINGLIAIRSSFEPTVEIGKMVLHHLTHSKQVLLREDVDKILSCNGSRVAGAAIGHTEHELMTGELAVTFVKVRLDLLLAIDDLSILNVGCNDKVWGNSDDRTLKSQSKRHDDEIPYLSWISRIHSALRPLMTFHNHGMEVVLAQKGPGICLIGLNTNA